MISSRDRKRQIKMIHMQYEQISEKWGYDIARLISRFEKRLSDATKNKTDMNVFFKAENEAIKIFEEKIEDEMEEEEHIDDELDEVSQAEDEGVPLVRSAFEGSYTAYNRIQIDAKASPEIEHLFGAMVDYRSMLMPALEESRRLIRDKAYQTMSYEIENLLMELGDNQGGQLPTVFSIYKAKVGRASGLEEMDRARMEPFKATVNIVRKINRLGRWAENHYLKIPSHIRLVYKEEDCNFRTFARYLVRDFNALVKNFGLQAFLEI